MHDKLCWVCPGAVTTQDLVNDDDIRLVSLIYILAATPLDASFFFWGGGNCGWVTGKI